MDTGTVKAHKISHASIAFFVFNSLFNISEILVQTPFDKNDLILYVIVSLLLSLLFSLPLFFKKHAPLVMIMVLILGGITKFFLSYSGDVSGWSIIVTAINYYIITYRLNLRFIFIVLGIVLVCSVYYFATNKFGFNSVGNMLLYFVYVFYIRFLVYDVPVFRKYKVSDNQKIILEKITEGKISKEIYPDLNISLSQYNNEKSKLKTLSKTKTDASLIAWAIKNKVI